MKNSLKIIKTDDDSTTLKSSMFDETYHSINGAISESLHVFINSGLAYIKQAKIKILEIGFGSGLNAILTFDYAIRNKKFVEYHSIEKYPIDWNNLKEFVVPENLKTVFEKIHRAEWNKKSFISEEFEFLKIKEDLLEWQSDEKYDLIYFDAFSYNTQPEMWSESVFRKIYNICNKNAILVTYSSKGVVKRNLRSAGFVVTRIQGYKKHHILRAFKK